MPVSFSLSPVREVEHNGGSAQSWEQDTFSSGFPGLGTEKTRGQSQQETRPDLLLRFESPSDGGRRTQMTTVRVPPP